MFKSVNIAITAVHIPAKSYNKLKDKHSHSLKRLKWYLIDKEKKGPFNSYGGAKVSTNIYIYIYQSQQKEKEGQISLDLYSWKVILEKGIRNLDIPFFQDSILE